MAVWIRPDIVHTLARTHPTGTAGTLMQVRGRQCPLRPRVARWRSVMHMSTMHRWSRVELVRIARPIVGPLTALRHLLVLLREIRIGVMHERGTRVYGHVGPVGSLIGCWWWRWRRRSMRPKRGMVRRRLSAVPPTLLSLTFLLIHLVDHPGQRVERVGRNIDHLTRVGSAWRRPPLRTPVSGRPRHGRLRSIPVARRLSSIRIGGRRTPICGRPCSTARFSCTSCPGRIVRDHAQERGRIRARQGERRHPIHHRAESHHASKSWRKPCPTSWRKPSPESGRIEPSVTRLRRHPRRRRVGTQSRRAMGHPMTPRGTRQHSRRQRTRSQRGRQAGPRKVRSRFERCGRGQCRDGR